MMKHIIPLLLLTCGLSAQTKWRQIERSAVKWNVPAAYDSIPGQTGYASKYIDLQTLMDTVGIELNGAVIDSLDYRNDSLLIWVGGGYYFAIIPQGSGYLDPYVVSGDTVGFILQTVQDTVEIVGASTGGGGGGGGGTVTSVAISGTGISVSGSPITTSGTITLTAADQSATNEIQQIDTFQVVGSQLRLSLTNDGQPYKYVTLTSGGGGAVDSVIAGDGINVTIASGDYTVAAKGAQYARLAYASTGQGYTGTTTAGTYIEVQFNEAVSSTDLTATIVAGGSADYITVNTAGVYEISYYIAAQSTSVSSWFGAIHSSVTGTQDNQSKTIGVIQVASGSTGYASLSGSYVKSCVAGEVLKMQIYCSHSLSGVTFWYPRFDIKRIK